MNANRLGHKNSKDHKGRPKSTERTKSLKGKLCENTTEEIANDEADNPSNGTEVNEEIEEYKINPDFLQSNHSPQPPKERPKESIVIRRAIPTSKYKLAKPKEKVIVAKPIQSEEQIDVSTLVQSKPAEPTDVKPYDVLGSVKEFKQHAVKERQIQLLSAKNSFNPTSGLDSSEKNDELQKKNDDKHIDQSNAIRNWEKQMQERRKQQAHLSKQMKTSKEMLLMNQSDAYRSIQEERTVIDRAMPLKDYGKGYRVGSEFWKQVEGIGGDEGISITLNETEKGNVAQIEHIGHPGSIKAEMGCNWLSTDRMKYVHYTWWNSPYLEERRDYLKDVINELDPHKPYMDGLEVIGQSLQMNKLNQKNSEKKMEHITDFTKEVVTESDYIEVGQDEYNEIPNDPLSEFQDVIAAPIFGPSLLINGHSASWEGSYNDDDCEEVGLDVRLSFEANVGGSKNSFIDMTNDGTTALHYSWKKLPKYDPFGLKRGRPVERFYFDIRDGIILPGQTINISFTFKSSNVGIFTEEWCLQTHPVLCAGKQILVTLHGIATQKDKLKNEREELQKQYIARQNEQMASRLVEEILRGIRTPPRPSSPAPPLTEEQEFMEKNQKLHYHTSGTARLKTFFSDINPDDDWDLSVASLIENVEKINKENEKEDALQRLNNELVLFYRPRQSAIERNNYDHCYQIICEYVDKFVTNSMALRQKLALPEKDLILKQEATQQGKKNRKVIEAQKATREAKSPNKKDATPTKAKTPSNKDKAKPEVTLSTKDDVTNDQENRTTVATDDTHHVNYGKYLEKMYGQVYVCLQDMADDIESILSINQ